MLCYFDLKNKIIVKTDTFNEVMVRVLLQKDAQKIVQFIIYFFTKMTLIKLNYKIYNKKFLAIV